MTTTETLIGITVIVLNLLPIIFKKYKYLLITIILSLILMYLGLMI